MKRLHTWICRNRQQLVRWSLVVMLVAPLAAWGMSRLFAIDAGSVVAVIGAALFAIWRPYRDSWLRTGCRAPTQVCASH